VEGGSYPLPMCRTREREKGFSCSVIRAKGKEREGSKSTSYFVAVLIERSFREPPTNENDTKRRGGYIDLQICRYNVYIQKFVCRLFNCGVSYVLYVRYNERLINSVQMQFFGGFVKTGRCRTTVRINNGNGAHMPHKRKLVSLLWLWQPFCESVSGTAYIRLINRSPLNSTIALDVTDAIQTELIHSIILYQLSLELL
jgi:hypothetical protein